MPNKFSSGKFAIAECDRCGQRYKLKELRKLVVKQQIKNIKVCPSCWDPDQPQLSLGMYPVDDPQALRNPRKDTSYLLGGLTGLQIETVNPPNPDDEDAFGLPSGGSRIIQWGWAPVGGSRANDASLTPNNLFLTISLGTVTVATT